MHPLRWLCLSLAGLLLSWTLAGSAAAKIDATTRLLERSSSFYGPTGWINIPSAAVPDSGALTAAIHRAEAKLDLSLLGILEGGISFEADSLGTHFENYRNLSSWERAQANLQAFAHDTFRGHAKLKVCDQDWAGISLAAGIEEQNLYVVVERYLPSLSRVTILAGMGTRRFSKGFGGFSKAIQPGADFIFEYDGIGINAGIRMLLSQNLIVNFSVQNLNTIGEVQNLGEVIADHLMFGITFVEKAW